MKVDRAPLLVLDHLHEAHPVGRREGPHRHPRPPGRRPGGGDHRATPQLRDPAVPDNGGLVVITVAAERTAHHVVSAAVTLPAPQFPAMCAAAARRRVAGPVGGLAVHGAEARRRKGGEHGGALDHRPRRFPCRQPGQRPPVLGHRPCRAVSRARTGWLAGSRRPSGAHRRARPRWKSACASRLRTSRRGRPCPPAGPAGRSPRRRRAAPRRPAMKGMRSARPPRRWPGHPSSGSSSNSSQRCSARVANVATASSSSQWVRSSCGTPDSCSR